VLSATIDSTTPVVVELQTEQQSFLNDSVDLKKLQKELKKVSKAAIEVMVKILENDKSSDEMKMKAAMKLLDLEIEVAKVISADQLQRLVADIKLIRGPKQLVPVGEDKNRPLVDFHTVRSIE
jgi:hypothetical protein